MKLKCEFKQVDGSVVVGYVDVDAADADSCVVEPSMLNYCGLGECVSAERGISVEAQRIAAAMSSRYFVIDGTGEFADRNEFGKALSFAFQQLPAALRTARRRGMQVWDSKAQAFVEVR